MLLFMETLGLIIFSRLDLGEAVRLGEDGDEVDLVLQPPHELQVCSHRGHSLSFLLLTTIHTDLLTNYFLSLLCPAHNANFGLKNLIQCMRQHSIT